MGRIMKAPILKTKGDVITVTNPYSLRTFKVSKEDKLFVEKDVWSVSMDYTQNIFTILKKADKHHNNKVLRLSRLIMKAKPNEVVFFRNGDTTDLRRCNMICTSKKTGLGQKIPAHNKSGFKGVFWNKRRRLWTVHITVDHKMIYLGGYMDIIEAAKVYNNAALKYHGKFARLNDLSKPGSVLDMVGGERGTAGIAKKTVAKKAGQEEINT